MNKQCYRIIFSRTQGELRVVSELARSCSSQPGQSRGTGGARLWVTVRRALWLIGLALFVEPVLANGIVADGQLAPAQRPEVINTQNGLQQVNINAPNQAGISHNQYQQFDVGQQGAILNNSAVMTSTQLAGYIQGNAKLNPNAAPASVIINEVNSNNPSQLRGFLEVAGGKAQVVVANPSGIVCDGCGTINAGRMTLTTGKPQLNADGSLAGYQVERGLIRIEGGGLNGDSRHDTEYVDILAQAVQVNAGVWAREGISVVAGRNQVSADGKTASALAAVGDNAPELAIDMGQMGGMYSGHIRMVGTEAGVGVRNQGGHLQADKTLTVSSEGKLTWQAGTAEPYTQAGGDITLTARDSIEHQGKLYSGGQLVVQSRQGDIRQSGTLAAAGNVTLRAGQGIQSSGNLLAGSDANSTLIRPADLTLESQADIRASGSLLSQKKVSVTGRQVDLSQSRLAAGQAVLTAQAGDVVLQQAQVDSEQLTINSQGHLYTQQAQIRAGNWHITADSLFNQAGVWSQVGAGESRFALTGMLDNTDGSIETQQLSLDTASLTNLRGRLVALDGTAQHWRVSGVLTNQSGVMGSNGSLQLDVGALTNQQGTLQSQSSLVVTAQNGLDNSQGKLLSGGNLTLNSQGTLNNRAGEIRGQSLYLAAQAVNNAQGMMVSQGQLRLDARQSIDNQQGLIDAGDGLEITTEGRWDNRQGTALGGSQARIVAGSLDNAAGRLQSGGELTLTTAGDVNNQAGTLTAQQDLSWQGGALSLFNNDEGKLLSGGSLSLNGGQLNNRQQGLVQSQQALALNLSGAWDNQGGKLASGGSSTVRALSLVNTQGEIQALDALDMQFTRALDNRSGNIISQRAQRLQAENIFNTQGWIGSLGTLTAVSQRFDNQQGEVVSQQDASLTVTIWNNQYGILQSATNLVLRAAQDVYNQGGKISAQTRLLLQGVTNVTPAGTLHNAGGQLLAGEQLQIQAQGIDNQQNGLLYSQKQLQLTLNDQLDNRLGKVQSGEGMQISAAQLLNAQGVIDSQQQLSVQLAGLLDNTQGTVRTNQGLQLSADRVQNAQGVMSSLGSLQLTARQLDNSAGTLISQGAGDYRFTTLNNQQGKIHSGDSLSLDGSTVNNQGGQLVSTLALTLNSDSVDNSTQGIISSQGALSLNTRQVNNRDGGLLMGTTDTTIRAQTLDNTAGRIQSAGTLTLSQLDWLDNHQGYLLANNNLSISGSAVPALALSNQGGTIQSGGALTVSTQTLNNLGGTLLSRGALTLDLQQDYTHQATDILSSNTSVTFRLSGIFTNLADWLLPGELILSGRAVNNLATLVAGTLTLTTGALTNQGRIEADTLTLDVDSLDNQATLMADTLSVNSRTLDNHGSQAVIAATENISLITGETMTNRDGALIYSAGNLSLTSGDMIENRASQIQAQGEVTIAAQRLHNLREGLDIARDAQTRTEDLHLYNYYWRSYGEDVNTDVSSMAPVTQRLTFNDATAANSNPYGTILAMDAASKQAQVQVKDATGSLISLWVNYLALIPNADGSYDMTFYGTQGWRQRTVPTPYQNTVWWNATDSERIELWSPDRFIDIASAPYVTDYNNLRERSITGTVTTDQLISAGVGASLLSGGNMTLHIGAQLLNDASTLSSNGNLTIDGTANIVNQGYSVNERRQGVIVDHYDRAEGHWYPTYNLDETTALTTLDGIISGYGNVSIQGVSLANTTVNQAQISAVDAARNAAAAERAEWERNPLAVNIEGGDWQAADTGLAGGSQPLTPGELALTDLQHLANVATTIPNNGLFRQQTEPDSPFLVVTDPRFANKSNFLSSDYLLQRVGYDPSQVMKRLGDGYYEQQVVTQQLLALTGRQSLQGDNAMAQYQALMNNGIKVAEDFHLVPGVALTPSQIAALQQDIVWLVSETVQTADGPQTVWVPQVYLANTTVRVSGDGAVIAGGNLQLSTDSLSNAANLFADKALGIDTGSFLHQGGDIRADTINVQADSTSLSTNLQDALRQAGMNARELSLSGGDISLQGAKLSATESLSLSASNSLSITTARSSYTADLNILSGAMGSRTSESIDMADGRMAQVSGEWQQALGSSVTSGGNLSLKAGQDITVQGSQVQAGGQLGLLAGGDISLLADTTTNNTHLEANSRTSTVSNSRQADTLHTTTLSGSDGVTMLAGGDFVAEGAQVESASGSIGLSAQQVTIEEARQQLSESDSEQSKVGKTQSQRETESSSDVSLGSVFSAKEGITVIAGQGDITVQGSTLQSEQGSLGLKAAGDITLTASQDEQHFKQQGSSSSKGVLSSSQSAYQREEHSSTANGSLLSGDNVTLQAGNDLRIRGSAVAADGDITLNAKNNVTVEAATNTTSYYEMNSTKKSGVFSGGNLGVTVGSQSSKSERKGAEVTESDSRSIIGTTGGNVIINAGDQVTLSATDVVAGRAAGDNERKTGHIDITGSDIAILPGRDSITQDTKQSSKSSGLTISVADPIINGIRNIRDIVNSDSDGITKVRQLANEIGATSVDMGMGAALPMTYGRSSSNSESHYEGTFNSGSTLNASGNVQLTATGEKGQGDILIRGSQVSAGEAVIMDAKRDVAIVTSTDSEHLSSSASSKGWSVTDGMPGLGAVARAVNGAPNNGNDVLPFAMDKSNSTADRTSTTENASLISGSDIYINSREGSVAIAGSSLTSVNDLLIGADKGNITVTTGNNTIHEAQSGSHTMVGNLGGDGYSGTVGWQKDDFSSTADSNQQSTLRSQIVSQNGNVSLQAGEDVSIHGADISAGKSLLVSGNNVLFDVSEDSLKTHSESSSTQYGVKGQVSGWVASAAQTAEKAARSAQDGDDPRLTGIYAAQTGLTVATQTMQSNMNPSAFKVSASATAGKSAQEQDYSHQQQQGSTLQAGDAVVIKARNDIVGQGVDISGKSVVLDAGRDIVLNASQDSESQKSSTSGNSVSAGVGFSMGGSQNGFTGELGYSQNQSREDGSSQSNNNSKVHADDTLTIISGRDTTLTGAELSADKVIADIGRDLSIASVQDSARYDSKSTSSGMNLSVCIPPVCYGSVVEGSVSANAGKLHNNFTSVTDQSGIYAGQGGFDITVGNHTQLDGAVLASEATADKNHLDTGTLGWSELKNESEWSGKQGGFTVSGGAGLNKDTQQYAPSSQGLPSTGLAQVSGKESGITQSAIADGTITIRDKEGQQQDVAELSRDTANANHSVEDGFDKDKVQDKLDIQKEAVALGIQAADAYKTSMEQQAAAKNAQLREELGQAYPEATKEQLDAAVKSDSRYIDAEKEYGPGSDFWRETSAATGLLAGILGGNLQGGLAAGAAPYMSKLVKDAAGENEAARIALHGIVSAALTQLQGGDALAGAAGGMASAALMGNTLSKAFYGKNVDELDAEQRTFISNLATAVGVAAGGSVGGDTFSASSGANAARVEVENNSLSLVLKVCGVAASCRNKVAEQLLEIGAKAGIVGLAGATLKDVADNITSDELDHLIMLQMMGTSEITEKYLNSLQDKYAPDAASNPNIGKDLTDEQKKELGGTGSGTPGGWGPEDEENARNSEQKTTVDDLMSSSSKGQETTGRSKLFERTGGSDAANKEFDSLAPTEIKDIPGGRVGKLPDGRTVIVRERSTDGRPTLEIQSGKNRIKFRYDE
ncbi:hemagglutinin repeat-containing protein [Edaphovirga cremea]|uniref:hemagglutinin repeat-containing protein n=1 Tax=Edaphovirga cremea TaxID=2267246 RepID=UPI000DEFC56C|nr:hemagglutinin repeat-containing protein [Edaphovirga cremea]